MGKYLKKLEEQFKTDQRKHWVTQQVVNLCITLPQEAAQASEGISERD